MSAQFMFGPNDLATRICAAKDCPDESSIGHALCPRHERAHASGRVVELHELPAQQEPVLKCSACYQWLPDQAFPPSTKRLGGPVTDRRGRSHECTTCAEQRETAALLGLAPNTRDLDNQRQRARRAARKNT